MPTTFIKRDTNSDLSSGGNHNKVLNETTAALVTLVISVPQASSVEGYHFTESGIPGADGVTGDYTVELNVTTAQNDIQVAVTVARVDSSGTVQSESTLSAEQQATAGVMTFNLTSVDLGTWATGDRLRVRHRFRNTHQHSSRDIEVGWNTTDSEVVAPWSTSTPLALGTVTETESAQPLTITSSATLGTVVETESAQPLTLGTGGGGTTISESFDQPDSTTLGPDLTWTELGLGGDLQIVSNQLNQTGTNTEEARAEHDLSGEDAYAQLELVSFDDTSKFTGVGVNVRFDATARTYYQTYSQQGDATEDRRRLRKRVNGTSTDLASDNPGEWTLPTTARVEAEGSTVRALWDSVEVFSVTDTEVTGHLRSGVIGVRAFTADNFEAGDLGVAALALGTVTETESVHPLTVTSSATLGTAAETESAQPLTISSALPLGTTSEAESARPLTVTSTAALGTATETEAAQPFTVDSTLPYGTVTETESAQPLTISSTAALGTATEAEAVQPLTISSTASLGTATETEGAQPLAVTSALPLGTVTESESARPLQIAGVLTLGTVTETETAGTFTVTSTASLGTATESEAAQPLTVTSTGTLGTVTESETAVAFTMAAADLILGTVTETEDVRPLSVTSTGTLGTATESEQAGTFTVTSDLPLATVTETETAGTIAVTSSATLGTVTESEAAQPFVLSVPDTAAAITVTIREPDTTLTVKDPSMPTVREPAYTATVRE